MLAVILFLLWAFIELCLNKICRLIMSVSVDNEDHAEVVLICSGHFNDPDLEGRLTDITRQLHMLTTGYTHSCISFFIHLRLHMLPGHIVVVQYQVQAVCL